MPSEPFRLTAVVTTAIAFAVSASGCSKKPPEAVIFKANSPIPVSLSLLKAEGQVGRSSPIGNNYRPQVRFPRGALESTCAVALPPGSATLDPGQTTDASLSCDSQVEVEPGKPAFSVFEGGKQVGQGSIRLP